jgi:hypothetical protein
MAALNMFKATNGDKAQWRWKTLNGDGKDEPSKAPAASAKRLIGNKKPKAVVTTAKSKNGNIV